MQRNAYMRQLERAHNSGVGCPPGRGTGDVGVLGVNFHGHVYCEDLYMRSYKIVDAMLPTTSHWSDSNEVNDRVLFTSSSV